MRFADNAKLMRVFAFVVTKAVKTGVESQKMVQSARAVPTTLGRRNRARGVASSVNVFFAHLSMLSTNRFVIHASTQSSRLIALHVINWLMVLSVRSIENYYARPVQHSLIRPVSNAINQWLLGEEKPVETAITVIGV
jgi:hypothetical protein